MTSRWSARDFRTGNPDAELERGRGWISNWRLVAPALLRLLRTCGMEFVTVGPLVEHHGARQPCFAAIADLLAGVKAANPAYFEVIRHGLPRPSVYQTDVTASTAYANSNSQLAVGRVVPPQ